jgi:hypothetical protein
MSTNTRWTFEGNVFTNTGTFQMYNQGMLKEGTSWLDEPSVLASHVLNWLKEHNSSYSEDIIGVPTFKFPDDKTAVLFGKIFNI